MNTHDWRPLEDAPKNTTIYLLVETTTGGYHVEIGKYDEVKGGFYTSGELWPIQIEPVAWQPIIPVDLKKLAKQIFPLLLSVVAFVISVIALAGRL